MKYKKWWLVGGAILMAYAAVSRALGGESASFQPWRCAANGGVNVLYCYLRAQGVPCKYSDLLEGQSHQDGSRHTAASLSRLAAQCGVPLQPVSLSMEELASCPRPVIAHMDGESPEAGAFLLVLDITDQAVHYVNGPTASVHALDRDSFRRVWSGVVLLPRPTGRLNVPIGLAGLALGLILPWAFRFFSRRFL